jgi:hypothetical protein
MQPTPKGDGRWTVFIPRKFSASGKREAKYFPSKSSAAKFVAEFKSERAQHGKDHNTPAFQASQDGPFDQWPIGMGFEYFYGFVGGDTSQW